MPVYELLLNSEGAFFLLVTLACFALVVRATVEGLSGQISRSVTGLRTPAFGGIVVSVPSVF